MSSPKTSFQSDISEHIVPHIIGGDNLSENSINILKRKKQNIKQDLVCYIGGDGWGASANGRE